MSIFKFPVESLEFGKNPFVSSFVGRHVGIRRSDGAVVSTAVSPYPALLHGYVMGSGVTLILIILILYNY